MGKRSDRFDVRRLSASLGSTLGPVARIAGAALGGLAAGATAAHLLYTQGHRVGLDLRQIRPPEAPPPEPTPKDYDTRDPGRGRLARSPLGIPARGWGDILWRAGGAYLTDRVSFVAGGVTFFMVLSLFPMLAAFVTLYGLFADPAEAWSRLEFLYSVLPANVAEFLGAQMQRLAEGSTGQMTFTLVWTLLLSLWAANGGVKNLFHGLNVAYREVEKRNIVTYNLVCLGFTLSALAAVLFSAALVVGVPLALGLFGLEDEWGRLAPLRWPLLFVGYALALALIYRMGPCRARARWRWLTPGAVFAASLSLLLSLLFSWYLTSFVRTDSYGPLTAVMGFLLWTWLTVQIILIGAKLNAEIEHQTAVDTTTGPDRPIGRRGAVMADSIGARRGRPPLVGYAIGRARDLSARVRRR